MKNTFIGIVVILGVVFVGYAIYLNIQKAVDPGSTVVVDPPPSGEEHEADEPHAEAFDINPVSHATAVLHWGSAVIYMDPVGGAEAFSAEAAPDLVLVTDVHGDHLSVETLEAVVAEDTTIVAPQAVADELGESLLDRVVVVANGETTLQKGFSIEAIPMYNLPESEDAFHVKGRGNGYVLEHDDARVYIAGDTEDVPEMRELENIDYAFVPMNLPYTMDVESAANGVLAFAPGHVYPYHYRNGNGTLSDVDHFKELVEAENAEIEVILLNWYPNEPVE